ncbi:MAG TPA: hypothetical protein VFK04_12860 [Gemmatimonadaceae bacterium]|nr:hypothetical protein [Gemmatimonadaceae bacterium]
MPTDTQRAPTLTQCIEREREAEDYATPPHPGNENCDTCAAVRAARAATDEAVRKVDRDERQSRVAAWTVETFGAESMSRYERAARFIEEAVELAQACGIWRDVLDRIVARVYGKENGDPASEVGNVGLTLLALAAALNVSADDAERRDIARVEALPADHWHKRHAAKAAQGIVFDWATPAPTAQGESTGGGDE